MRQRWLLMATLGVGCFFVTWLLLRFADATAVELQIQLSDLFMVREGGPRLGERPASSDIVIVQFDQTTASTIGYSSDYANDLALYRTLFAANAKVVFDTRMVAAATNEAYDGLKPLIRGIADIDRHGRVMRDIWLSAELLAGPGAEDEPLFAHNVINSHPHAIPMHRSRVYPLAFFNGLGARETAPLRIARTFYDLPQLSPAEVGESLRQSGIMSLWHDVAPALVPDTDVDPAPYPIDDIPVHWIPFQTGTMLVPPAAFWVSYDPPADGFDRVSYADVLQGKSRVDLENKIVLVGFTTDVDPASDSYVAPNQYGKSNAVDVVACAVQTLMERRTMRQLPIELRIGMIGLMCVLLTVVGGCVRPSMAILVVTGLLSIYLFGAVHVYRAGWFADFAFAPLAGLAGAMIGGVAGTWLDHRSHRRVVDLFGRYVPRAVVQELMAQRDLESLQLAGSLRDVTVLFADIRGFTSFASQLPPKEVVRQLNSLLKIMVECTFEQAGTLDKFIGDAILVLYNAPLDQSDHALRAVRTAVEIQRRLEGNLTGLSVGIGIHSGDAVVGSIGTPERMEYTAIGSTVNIASRLCDTAQSGQVVMSERVAAAVQSHFSGEPMGPIAMKGIPVPMPLFLVKRR